MFVKMKDNMKMAGVTPRGPAQAIHYWMEHSKKTDQSQKFNTVLLL